MLWLVKYQDGEVVRPVERRDLGRVQRFVVTASMNPFISDYFGSPVYLFELEQMLDNVEEVDLFTYISDEDSNFGKVRVERYPHPSYFIEMEFRLVLRTYKEYELVRGDEELTRRRLLWTGLLDMAEAFTRLGRDMRYSFASFFLAVTRGAQSSDDAVAQLIKLVGDYDRRIVKVAEFVGGRLV